MRIPSLDDLAFVFIRLCMAVCVLFVMYVVGSFVLADDGDIKFCYVERDCFKSQCTYKAFGSVPWRPDSILFEGDAKDAHMLVLLAPMCNKGGPDASVQTFLSEP